MMYTRFPFIALTLLVFAAACTSIYEVGDDRTDEFSVESVTAVNSMHDEVAPMPVDGGLIFTSNRPLSPEADEGRDMLYFARVDAGIVGSPRPVTVDGAQDVKTGSLALFPEGRAMLVVQCYRDDGIGDCDMLEGRLADGGARITDLRLLEPPVNDVEWDHHPTLSSDGRMLVFASERFGGHGGSDLWITAREGDGGWSRPANLGSAVNTSGNEIAPHLSSDGSELYFASDSHPGMGGFDIYRSRRTGEGWGPPEILPRPFNSDADDVFFSGTLTADTTWLASDRGNDENGFDIYRVVRRLRPTPPEPEPEKPIVLRITAKNAFTKETIDAAISVTHAGTENLAAEGSGVVEMTPDMGSMYTVTATHPGYMHTVEDIRTGGFEDARQQARPEDERIVIERDIMLIPVAEKERKIYAFTVEFDFNLFNIRPEEERKLDSAAVLLEMYPNSTVVISGHTDSVGTNMYNIRLGYNRAKEVSDYVGTWLRRQNVRLKNDIEIRTYGEAEPIAPNRTEEGRQRNRRVEIAIVRNE